MVERIVFVLVARILTDEPCQGFLAQVEVVELILEDDTTVIERIGEGVVARLELLCFERDLCKIELTLVRV